VLNDARITHSDTVMTAHLSWGSPDGRGGRSEHAHVQRWQGDVAADSCAFVGTLRATAPDHATEVLLDLHLVGPDLDVTNRYVVPVAPGHHQH